jgi:hypothetical protein
MDEVSKSPRFSIRLYQRNKKLKMSASRKLDKNILQNIILSSQLNKSPRKLTT